MAKIKTMAVGGSLLPEGRTQFKILKVDDSKYDDFGKLEIRMVTKEGQAHTERFGLINSKGEVNEGAVKAWSFWVGTILGVWGEQEVDSDELEGKFFEGDVSQVESDSINEDTGKPYVNNRIENMKAIDGFDGVTDDSTEEETDGESEEDEDLDDFLDD
jgi:hypothetical protein